MCRRSKGLRLLDGIRPEPSLLVPLTFVGVMLLGGALGQAGMVIPFVEAGIVASVLIFGVLVAAAVRLPLAASAAVVGLFAFFHGHAHGTEMPAQATLLAWAAGFTASTVCVMLCGVGIGRAARRTGTERLVRFSGAAVAACGVYLCVV